MSDTSHGPQDSQDNAHGRHAAGFLRRLLVAPPTLRQGGTNPPDGGVYSGYETLEPVERGYGFMFWAYTENATLTFRATGNITVTFQVRRRRGGGLNEVPVKTLNAKALSNHTLLACKADEEKPPEPYIAYVIRTCRRSHV